MNKRTHSEKPRALFAALLMLAALLVSALFPAPARAEQAVDTLTIKVGYTGMDLKRYTTAGTWNWAKLYHELPLENRAYSYFQSPGASEHPSTDSISTKEYNAIVDSANGFYITDLLDYANLYISDIYNIGFYVTDHNNIWTSFDTGALFESRYYFNNLPAHRRETEDGYDFSDAWNDCEEVPPMLAIEDNWASYTQDFDNIGPDYTDVKPGNRFHLLFGQVSPTQQLSRESAKYIDCLYVTMKGKPKFSAKDVKISGKLGSHTAKMTAQVDNEAMIRQLKDLLNLQSTDENVLKIKDIRVVRDEDYSDLATVEIDYDIVGKGKASITGDFGGSADYTFETETVEGGSDSGSKPSKPAKNPSDKKKQNQKTTNKKKPAKKNDLKNETAPAGSGSGVPSARRPGTGAPAASTGTNAPSFAEPELTARASQASEAAVPQKIKRPKTTAKAASPGIFRLSKNLHDRLKGMSEEREVTISAKEDVTELKMKDDRDEQKKADRMRVLIASIGGASVMAAGAFWEEIGFRMRLRKRPAKAHGGK